MKIESTQAGYWTGEFGKCLTDYLRGIPGYQDYLVYYDHGDPLAHSNVAAIKGMYGEEVSSMNQLAQVDVLVAKPDHEIHTIVEVEESPCSPKKILGDAFALFMCDRFSVRLSGKNQTFRITPETRLIIAGIMVTKGSKLKQLEKVILPRLKHFTVPGDSIDPRNVHFIFKGTILETFTALKETLMAWFP